MSVTIPSIENSILAASRYGRWLAFAWLLASCRLALAEPLQKWPEHGFARGIVLSSWDGSYPHKKDWLKALKRFKTMGINWIEIMTFAHQPSVSEPSIHMRPDTHWPREFVKAARLAGFKILLKPHVWSRQFYDGSNRWRGSIKMNSEGDWKTWFSQYEDFIVREAKLAQANKIEMLSVGLEYVEATKRPKDWRRIIKKIRAVYGGALTYAADGNHELPHIEFWDDLDVIGVDAYFAQGTAGGLFGLERILYWARPISVLSALSKTFKKPIIFTEAGYPSIDGATARPWQWPKGHEKVDLAGQAKAYDALLMALTPYPWFQGVFWWKWYERPEKNVPHSHDYSPRDKPAEEVLRLWYTRTPSSELSTPNE